jgi:hypothetical protein
MVTEKQGQAEVPAAHRVAGATTADRHDTDAQDVAIAMVGETSCQIDPVVTARAVRKIDWFLIPAMIFGCTSQNSSVDP